MSKRPVVAEDLLRFKLVSDPQMCPIGDAVLFGIKTVGEKNKALNHLFLTTTQGDGGVTALTHGDKSVGNGRWSHDGANISFVSARTTPGPQIFILPNHGEARQLTALAEGSIGATAWSPDGKYIAYTFRETHADFTEAGKKKRTDEGLSTAPWTTSSVWYRLDGDGYFGEQRYKLYKVEVATGISTLLMDSDPLGSYSFDWFPTSEELAVIISVEKSPLNAPPNNQIFRVKLDGSSAILPGLPKGEKECVKVSPDGKWIAYGGDQSEDDPWGARNTKLYIVSATGGAPRDLTGHEDFDLGVATLSDTKEATFGAVLAWCPTGKAVYAQIGSLGKTHIGRISVESGGTELVTSGNCSLGLGGMSRDGKSCVGIYGDAQTVPEIHSVNLADGSHRPLTTINQAWHDEVELATPEEVWLTSSDGHKVQGWIMKPATLEAGQKVPALLEIHGGPHAAYGWVFFHEFQVLASAGYAVLYTNPRGSQGYGEAHCAAIQGDWGNADWVDVQAATKWLQAQEFIDSTKLGVLGGSYGGYMTNWVIGHCNDYAAAITDRCVSNMVSMAGNSDFPFNKDGYFKGVAWGSHEEIKELWRQSPIAYFQNVKTPTLIIHSEGDLRCNIEQGEQVFTALQQQGIPSRFVRYPSSTSHGLSRSGPADLRMHRLGEMLSWFKKYLG